VVPVREEGNEGFGVVGGEGRFRMQTGRKILNLRCDRKISQQELARTCGITPSALSKIEAGINSPRANVLWRIARNLGVTVEYLLDEGMPYPYQGYAYRQGFLTSNVDPNAMVRMDVTREEKAFIDALRQSNQVARDIAFAVPEASVEALRLVHFLLNHLRIKNPTQAFLNTFEALVRTGEVAQTPVPANSIDPDPAEAQTPRTSGVSTAAPRKRGRMAKESSGNVRRPRTARGTKSRIAR
jgi:DNA-binding XRE family transcriptional regulator